MENPDQLSQFIGRFHVVLLHLPIGFLVLLGAMEALSLIPRFSQANSVSCVILALAVPATLLTVICGWLLASGGGYDERLLWWHRWTGVGLGAAVCLLLLLHSLGWLRSYRVLLPVTLVLTMVAGHLGGSLTHGSGFLTQRAPWASHRSQERQVEGGADGYRTVAGIYDEYCVKCHGPEKSKADLRLDSRKHVLAGGEDGPVIAPGNADISPLIKRVILPPEDDDHMPPQGKPQPSPADIELMRQWINAGAPE